MPKGFILPRVVEVTYEYNPQEVFTVMAYGINDQTSLGDENRLLDVDDVRTLDASEIRRRLWVKGYTRINTEAIGQRIKTNEKGEMYIEPTLEKEVWIYTGHYTSNK